VLHAFKFGSSMLPISLVLAALPPSPFLPPLLRLDNGTNVTTSAAWFEQRRPEVAALTQDILLGRMPAPKPGCAAVPPLLEARTVNSSTSRGAVVDSYVNLTFGVSASLNVSFAVELLVPPIAAGSAAPVFLTQWTHRGWALLGVERGYIGVVYPGSDGHPLGRDPPMPTDAAPAFQAAYCEACGHCGPTAWALIGARAWVASRAIDYVVSAAADLRADASRICITGHSRNGKQARANH